MMHSGLVHGLAFWFDVAFIGSAYVPKHSLHSDFTLESPLFPLNHQFNDHVCDFEIEICM